MLENFNLLGTSYRRFERKACAELGYLLGQAGDPEARVSRTDISGVIVAKTLLDPFDVIKKLREILIERPYEFRYLLRVIPIERVVKTDMTEIVSVTRELASRIEENETFRVTVEKRFTEVSGNAIIKAVASDIKRKVNLSNPDKIVLIEIVGDFVGISVVKKSDIISVLKEKVL
jgi:tRNA acetyltransferase TAN1